MGSNLPQQVVSGQGQSDLVQGQVLPGEEAASPPLRGPQGAPEKQAPSTSEVMSYVPELRTPAIVLPGPRTPLSQLHLTIPTWQSQVSSSSGPAPGGWTGGPLPVTWAWVGGSLEAVLSDS